jgi:hypothetical protein
MGVGNELGFPLIIAAAYLGGMAAFFGYVFIAAPSVVDKVSEGRSPIVMAIVPTMLLIVVSLGLPFALLFLLGLDSPQAVEGAITVDTAMVTLPIAMLTPYRSSVASTVSPYIIGLAIGTSALPLLYVGVLLWERRQIRKSLTES